MNMGNKIDHVRLLAVREGTYTVYVFQIIESKEYIMCTRLPNWQVPDVSIGNIGFLEYQYVQAGESYYNPQLDKTVAYLYSNVYFINFIQQTDIIINQEIIL